VQESEEDLNELLPPKAGRKKDSPSVGDFLKYWPQEKRGEKYDLQLLQNCINYGLSILEIILGPEDEEDAIIFETINARGTELEKFDLVKNSFFLRLGDGAESYFDTHWDSFENRLETLIRPNGARGKVKDAFIYDYLVFLGIDKITNNKLYTKWHQYVRDQLGALGEGKDGEYFQEMVAQPMLTTSLLYPAAWGVATSVALENASKKLPSQVQRTIQEILMLTSGPTIPLHMLGLDAWLREKISSDDLLIWFKKIQGSVLRMVLADEPLNNLRASILTSASQLAKNPTLSTLSKILAEGTKNSDDHLRNLIKTSPFAKDENNKAVGLILQGIERQIRKDVAHPMVLGAGGSDWQIEHIYPQSPNGPGEDWTSDIHDWGFKRENYDPLKFTLGNITALTGTGNKKAAQKSFLQKKELFESSKLGVSESILDLKRWTPKEIQNRSTVLLTYFLQEWPEK
jgi:hypothetical protein